MGSHVALHLGAKVRQGLTTRHEIGDFLAGLFTLSEVGGDRPTDEDSEVVADGHRMCHLVRDEDDGYATFLCFKDDAQNV